MVDLLRTASDRWINLDKVTHIEGSSIATVHFGKHKVELSEIESENLFIWMGDRSVNTTESVTE